MKTLLFLAVLSLVSCADYAMTGRIFIVDPESGAKGGMTFHEDGTEVTGTFVDDDGNVIGGGSVFFPKIVVEK